MRKRYSMFLNSDVVDDIDSIRGMIDRSKFINAALEQKVEQIRNDGGVIGQI